jgi:PIN domain nuclease of toxin-antitoxin system
MPSGKASGESSRYKHALVDLGGSRPPVTSRAKSGGWGKPVLSIASYWEVVIKTRKGLLPISDPVSWWTRALQLLGAQVLPIWATHITALAALPDLHRDPFDRILIAQPSLKDARS